jgi:hypothetical protein
MKGDTGWVGETLYTGYNWAQYFTYELIGHWAGEYYKEQRSLSAVKEFLLGGHLIYKNKIFFKTKCGSGLCLSMRVFLLMGTGVTRSLFI